jgi:hypothetical protein
MNKSLKVNSLKNERHKASVKLIISDSENHNLYHLLMYVDFSSMNINNANICL